ncbi:MAG: amino acid permease [bacterium]|nr:amino acid permease [bacterium]
MPLPDSNIAQSEKDLPNEKSSQKFGTFLGVYTPSALTILGLIMYLRFGWVLGNLGLPLTILAVFLASSLTFVTGLSASALATNMKVGVGGEYFMVSRSLGIELGGAIGIPLFLCRTLSITFYSFGLSESILALNLGPGEALSPVMVQIVAAAFIVFTTAVSGRSASLALKMQIPIMIAVGVSLLALVLGVFSGGLHQPELSATYRTAPGGFWYVFAIFFPAVTGFTAGIGMSGDLKNPQKSIPRGTLLAVVTGVVVYTIVPFLLSYTNRMSPQELADSGLEAWTQVAVMGAWLVFPGLWGAILSSAFGSALGGPRVLQALASDGLAPRFMAKLSANGQPATATWISGAIAVTAVLLGGLNEVASFVSILFLTLYVTINLSAAFEKLAGDPSYRPRINVHWAISLLGSAGAIAMMFLISPVYCFAALVLELVIYSLVRRLAMRKRWGDVRAGLWLALTRFALLHLKKHEPDPRNWRPHILVFVGDLVKRISLVRLANWFNEDRGIVTVTRLVVGDLKNEVANVQKMHQEMERDLEDEGITAFSEVNIVQDFESGVVAVAQSNGIAGLHSNTVLFGWPGKRERLERLLRTTCSLAALGKNTIIARPRWSGEANRNQRIDIWWRGKQNNGDLMLLLTHLLTMNAEWSEAEVVIRSIVLNESSKIKREESLVQLIGETRIQAGYEVILKPEDQTVVEVIHSTSRRADVVFFGLMDPADGQESEVAERMEIMAKNLKTTIFVNCAVEFAGRLV